MHGPSEMDLWRWSYAHAYFLDSFPFCGRRGGVGGAVPNILLVSGGMNTLHLRMRSLRAKRLCFLEEHYDVLYQVAKLGAILTLPGWSLRYACRNRPAPATGQLSDCRVQKSGLQTPFPLARFCCA